MTVTFLEFLAVVRIQMGQTKRKEDYDNSGGGCTWILS